MDSIEQIPAYICQNLHGIFCDIDDTLTTDGKLLDCSYQALWNAYYAGLKIVPITGRPAGWVDHIARMWPVSAVIGENGAFYFWMQDNKMHRFFLQDQATRAEGRKKLEAIKNQILAQFPQVQVAADQLYRESDLAIDFCEDVPRVDPSIIPQILQIFKAAGAQAKVSSIHINGWFGDFNKLTTCYLLLEKLWNQDPANSMMHYIFCGDSPNDEPMFAAFPHTVGVANVTPWLRMMKAHPKYCTASKGGQGFAEMVNIILQRRKVIGQE